MNTESHKNFVLLDSKGTVWGIGKDYDDCVTDAAKWLITKIDDDDFSNGVKINNINLIDKDFFLDQSEEEIVKIMLSKFNEYGFRIV